MHRWARLDSNKRRRRSRVLSGPKVFCEMAGAKKSNSMSAAPSHSPLSPALTGNDGVAAIGVLQVRLPSRGAFRVSRDMQKHVPSGLTGGSCGGEIVFLSPHS